jgi:hypothetical protein
MARRSKLILLGARLLRVRTPVLIQSLRAWIPLLIWFRMCSHVRARSRTNRSIWHSIVANMPPTPGPTRSSSMTVPGASMLQSLASNNNLLSDSPAGTLGRAPGSSVLPPATAEGGNTILHFSSTLSNTSIQFSSILFSVITPDSVRASIDHECTPTAPSAMV